MSPLRAALIGGLGLLALVLLLVMLYAVFGGGAAADTTADAAANGGANGAGGADWSAGCPLWTTACCGNKTPVGFAGLSTNPPSQVTASQAPALASAAGARMATFDEVTSAPGMPALSGPVLANTGWAMGPGGTPYPVSTVAKGAPCTAGVVSQYGPAPGPDGTTYNDLCAWTGGDTPGLQTVWAVGPAGALPAAGYTTPTFGNVCGTLA